jgi:hypothetical protein
MLIEELTNTTHKQHNINIFITPPQTDNEFASCSAMAMPYSSHVNSTLVAHKLLLCFTTYCGGSMYYKLLISLLFLFFTANASVLPNLYMCNDDTLMVHVTYSTSSMFNKPVFGSIEILDENKEYYVSNTSQTDNDGLVVSLKIPKLLLDDYRELILFDTSAEIQSSDEVNVVTLSCEASYVLF